MKRYLLFAGDGIEPIGTALGLSLKELQTTTVDSFKSEENMAEENKIVFGNWEPIKLKSWTYSTTEDFTENEDSVNEPIGYCDPNLIIEGEEMAINSDEISKAAERMARAFGVSLEELEIGLKTAKFKKIRNMEENENPVLYAVLKLVSGVKITDQLSGKEQSQKIEGIAGFIPCYETIEAAKAAACDGEFEIAAISTKDLTNI